MNLLTAAILGGFFISDTTAFGQFMFSRPIFCGPVIGLLAGDVSAGLYVGMIMELIWITVIPLGGAVPPDSGAVASAAAYISAGYGPDRGFMVFIILLLVPLGILFKRIDMLHREFNVYFVHKIEEKLGEEDTSYVGRAALYGYILFFLKGFFFLLIIMGAGSFFLPYLYGYLPEIARESLGEVFFVMPAVGLGAVLTAFTFKKSRIAR